MKYQALNICIDFYNDITKNNRAYRFQSSHKTIDDDIKKMI
jgi:hypothetical protein